MRTKSNTKKAILISLLVFTFLFTFTDLTFNVKADDEEDYGVRGTGYQTVGPFIVTDYDVLSQPNPVILGEQSVTEYGMLPYTDSNYEVNPIYLPYRSRFRSILLPPTVPYVKNFDLDWEHYGGFRPYIVLRSEPWYDHYFELFHSSESTVKFGYDISLKIKGGYGNVVFTEGSSTTTYQKDYSSMEMTVRDSKTVVVYFWTTFMRINGSVTYFDDKTVNYDVVVLQTINYSNKHFEEYDYGETIEELPSALTKTNCLDIETPINFADQLDDIADKDTIGWSESKEYSKSFSLSLDIGLNLPEEIAWLKGLEFSVKFNWIEENKITSAVKHQFIQTEIPRPLPYFYMVFENPFSTNLFAVKAFTGQITSPTASSTKLLGDDILFKINTDDQSELSSVQLYIERLTNGAWSSGWVNAYYNEFLYGGWYWIWYAPPSADTYRVHCRLIDSYNGLWDAAVTSIVFYIDYGTLYTTSVQRIKGVYQSGGTAEGKYNDDVYYGIKTDADGWLWWRSITRFYFNDPGGTVISTHFEFQIQPCTSELQVRIKYVGDSGVGSWKPASYSSSGIQSQSVTAEKRVEYVEISQHVYWTTHTRLWIDFCWLRWRIY